MSFTILKLVLGILTLIFVATFIHARVNKTESNEMRLIIQSRSTGSLTVELDAFSGRANPAWKLTRDEENRLAEMVANLPARKKAAELPSGLGYRGIIIRDSKDFNEIVVSIGVVQADRYQWSDADRKVELFLLNTSRPHIESGIYEMIVSQIRSQ